jgi:hypothetical protein
MRRSCSASDDKVLPLQSQRGVTALIQGCVCTQRLSAARGGTRSSRAPRLLSDHMTRTQLTDI